ncbi:MAG: SDR family oxidoreductase [bacterium]|nr:SDR family oxidoreductase [bacterium]
MQRLIGRVALVTGGASGMGKQTALRLAREGARVVIGDIDEVGAKETTEQIREEGGEATLRPYDASLETSCVELVSSAIEKYGQLDVVANIAGISAFYRLDEISTEIFERFLSVNLTSPLIICREAMPHLKRTRGSIVNIASVNARVCAPYHAAYGASKAGILALTKSLAIEFAADGVRVNAICPGGFDTPMNEDHRMPKGIDEGLLARLYPLDEMGNAEQIAGLIAYLASDEASYISGEDIVIDGGLRSAL